jgi:hypothetical protein
MQRLVCGRWSSNNSLLVESAEPESDFQACDKVESTLCLLLPFYNAWIFRCICNFTTMKHNRVILLTQWDLFGRTWSHMIFHWLFYIQYQ